MTTVSTRKNAVILGATSGIGKNMALCLARQGRRVGVAGRRENLLAELRAEQPDSLVPQRIDIADPESLRAGLDKLTGALGRIDLAVICSGVGFLNPDLADDQERQTIAVNVAGFTLAADWFFRYFQQRGSGTLAAVTSVGGLLGEATAPAYSASKAYQIIYLDSLRKRARKVAPAIRITDIRPGSVDTAMMQGEGHFWISTPEAAAETACRAAIAGKKLQYISPRWQIIGVLVKLLGMFS